MHGRHSKGVGLALAMIVLRMRAMVYCGFGGFSLHACHTTNRLSTPFINGLSFCHLFGVMFVENKIKSKRFNPQLLLISCMGFYFCLTEHVGLES
jgi:hypothetical protein